ncbi:hypothetical protein HN371_29225 [Candidatus Poribacteria bacterium]|jgi:hypothetical protein|nr:hypothetical protein [Candidatus Poribacteria bacterium]MBT5533492.1 hypothetical protein [Candidatus Poribacteria bacterium]MBT5710138.1 hypothetical protein [Candidatus Poribacteria bacterium]MBT7100523.1 hypothetical protein [Candidatus Poribacteria bacterium]MBT7808889.1 hypothetical protein [Candidatus Poribacteria bacterium]
MKLVLPTLAVAVVVIAGCDYGDPMGLDADANSQDVAMLLTRWQAEGAIPEADVNGDGTVDIVDLVIVSQNFGKDVAVGTLTIVSDIVWRNEGGSPHGRVEVINNSDMAVRRMRIRIVVRENGLLKDVDDGSLITALIPAPGEDKTHIGPGEHGTGWVWASAAAWEEFQLGTVTIQLAIIQDADSLHAGEPL